MRTVNGFFFMLLCAITHGFAQNNFTALFEPEIELDYKVSSNYSQSFAVENRNYFYQEATFEYLVKHIELAHASEFHLNDNQSFGIGVQYRFNKDFEQVEENELRFLQFYKSKTQKESFSFSHRFRTEQRFYTSSTKYRLRYELALKFPLNSTSKALPYIQTETEFLFELAKDQKPEFEQRLSTLYGWNAYENTTFETGLQYRLADFTQDVGHELFVVFGISIDLYPIKKK